MSRIEAARTWVRDQFEAMSPRDRKIAVGLVLATMLAFTLGVTWGLKRALDDEASRVRVAKESLAEVNELAAEYQILAARVRAAEERMKGFSPGRMNTYLEQWAQKAGVAASLRVRPGAAQSLGGYQSVPYQVEISQATLDQVLEFLWQIETAQYPVRINTAKFRVDGRRDVRTLRADLEVVAYAKEQG